MIKLNKQFENRELLHGYCTIFWGLLMLASMQKYYSASFVFQEQKTDIFHICQLSIKTPN